MKSFVLINPGTLEEALTELANRGGSCRVIAGGTDLLPSFKKKKQPVSDYLINLKSISGLSAITLVKAEISVGALATHSQIAESEMIKGNALVLAEACSEVASWQIRNIATIGGNLVNASPAADLAPALLVLDASVKVAGPGRRQEIKIADFFKGPGETVLKPDEIIESVNFSAAGEYAGTAFEKLGRRKAVTLSIVSAAAYVKLSPDLAVIEEARLALGAVASVPLRVRSAEAELKGFNVDEGSWSRIHEAVRHDIDPITDVRSTAQYRLEVSGYIAERAVKNAIERAKKSGKGGVQ